MFGKSKVTDIERRLYENEIKSLRNELSKLNNQLEIAGRYKNEYKELAILFDFEEKR